MHRISLTEAIARFEGFGIPGSRATRNHNPGNLNYSTFSRAHGAISDDDKGYAVFTSNLDGYTALQSLLSSPAYRGKSFQDAILKFAPPTGDVRGNNDAASYIANVCEWCGVTRDSIIDAYVAPAAIAAAPAAAAGERNA